MRKIWIFLIIALLIVSAYFGYKSLNKSSTETGLVESSFDDVAYFNKLRDGKFSLTDKSALDPENLIALVPKYVSVTYAGSDFNETSGATTLTDVKITMTGNVEMGVNIEILSLWGVDADAISARVSGKRLDETIPIAKRIEADNLSMFGVEDWFIEIMETFEDMIETDGNSISIGNSLPAQSIEKLDFRIAKTVMTDFVLHPWVLELTDIVDASENDQIYGEYSTNDIWQFAQKWAAFNYAMSLGDYAFYDTTFDLDMRQDGIPFKMEMSYDLMGYLGFDRGDTKYSIVKGSRSFQEASFADISDNNSNPNLTTLKTESYTDYYTGENFNLSRLWEHMAKGKFPDRSETDLMSLGVWKGGASSSSFNGVEMFSVESFFFDISKFHWLVPEIIEMRFENMSMNIEGFMDYMEKTVEMTGSEIGLDMTMPEDQKQIMADSIEILKKYDLSKPVMDFAMAAHWDAGSGNADMGYSFDIDDFFRYKVKTDVVLPDYQTAMASIPEKIEDFDEEAFMEMLMQNSAFKKYDVLAVDNGGMEKSFAMAVDFAQLMPEDDPSSAMFRNTTPEILRNMASSGIMLAAGEASKAFPPAVEYLQSLSNFVAQGGSLSVKIEPENPLTADALEDLAPMLQSDPEGIVHKLDIQVNHNPPN